MFPDILRVGNRATSPFVIVSLLPCLGFLTGALLLETPALPGWAIANNNFEPAQVGGEVNRGQARTTELVSMILIHVVSWQQPNPACKASRSTQ